MPGRHAVEEEVGGPVGRGFGRAYGVAAAVPQVAPLAELNARLEKYDQADGHRRIGNRVRTVGPDFALEAPALRPLTAEPVEAGLVLTPRVDRHAKPAWTRPNGTSSLRGRCRIADRLSRPPLTAMMALVTVS